MAEKVSVAMDWRQADHKVIIACGLCGAIALLLFSLHATLGVFSAGFPVIVNLLKMVAFSLAAVLCWHNTRNPEILSGQTVWQAIAVGMACYVLGDTTTMLWRSLWDIQSTAALADIFYVASYLFLAVGLFQAVLPRQITLNLWQTLGISIPGVLGIVIASWITFQTPTQVPSGDSLGAGPKTVVANVVTAETAELDDIAISKAPAVVQTVEKRLHRITKHFGLLYVVGDCILVVLAAALLVTFWGGTYSEAWKLIALAGLCLYIADMFLIYQTGQGSYSQGAFWELFWVLSALCFGLGAGVENGISERMKQRAARRHWL